jgi:hypothetical protein
MSDVKKDSISSAQEPSTQLGYDEDAAEKRAEQERLEKEADEMAEKGQEDEKRYDRDHDIFTK